MKTFEPCMHICNIISDDFFFRKRVCWLIEIGGDVSIKHKILITERQQGFCVREKLFFFPRRISPELIMTLGKFQLCPIILCTHKHYTVCVKILLLSFFERVRKIYPFSTDLCTLVKDQCWVLAPPRNCANGAN